MHDARHPSACDPVAAVHSNAGIPLLSEERVCQDKEMKHSIIGTLLVSAVIGGSTSNPAAQTPGCAPSGGLTFVCGVQNAEDLVSVPNTGWLVASGMAAGSGLHLVDTQAKTVRKLYAAGTAA